MSSERSESWYSDDALAKQAALKETGGTGSFSDLFGIFAPRIPHTPAEGCLNCGMDARDGAGGDGDWCQLCLGRGRDEDHTEAEIADLRAQRLSPHDERGA